MLEYIFDIELYLFMMLCCIAEYDENTLPSALMTNDTVPRWIRQPTAWLAKHSQLYLMFEEFDKQRVRGHDVELRTMDTSDGDGSSGGAIWDSYAESATVALQEIGERKRKTVVYDDGLTEMQFMNMVEDEEKKQEKARVRASYCFIFVFNVC